MSEAQEVVALPRAWARVSFSPKSRLHKPYPTSDTHVCLSLPHYFGFFQLKGDNKRKIH